MSFLKLARFFDRLMVVLGACIFVLFIALTILGLKFAIVEILK